MASPFASLAQRAARVRRHWLLGGEGPAFARFRPPDLPTPDLAEDGAEAVRLWALWKEAEAWDDALARLQRVAVDARGQGLEFPRALAVLADETEPAAADSLSLALSRAAAPAALALAAVAARGADRAAGLGVSAIVDPSERQAAATLLAVTEEPVRDVLGWAHRRLGGGRARPTLPAVLRVLRNPDLDRGLQPLGDPFSALARWRQGLGLTTPSDEVADSGWLASWALRGRESRVVGVAAWPGALRSRFALQGLGRADALALAGRAALLPRDPAAASLLATLYPFWLTEPMFQRRVLGSETASPDTGRLLALSEVLLQRLQAGLVQLWSAFDQSRALAAVLEAVSGLGAALQCRLAPEVGLLLAAPWGSTGLGGISGSPRATFAAAALGEQWREAFDQDFWRNPRLGETLRQLGSSTALQSLGQLVPNGDGSEPYARWVEVSLGG